MNVTFTKTGERRYRVLVEGPGVVTAQMDPAPGYDPLLPHDMAHFVVEHTLGLDGVFGQLAKGGHAHTFRPVDKPKSSRAARRGDRISAASRRDAELSEKVIFLAQRTWSRGDLTDVPTIKNVSAADISLICAEFERVSATWSTLTVGESMTLVWTGGRTGKKRR
jgi:hypothetical protein